MGLNGKTKAGSHSSLGGSLGFMGGYRGIQGEGVVI